MTHSLDARRPATRLFDGRLLDLVLPRRCLGCGEPGTGLCGRCGATRPSVRFLPGLGMVHAGAGYRGAVGTAIVHYKDRDRRDLCPPLSALLSRAVQECESAEFAEDRARPLVVPVPSSRQANRHRGGDHLRRLATRAAGPLGLVVASPLYVRRDVVDASGLTARQRRRNVDGAFAVRPSSSSGAGPGAARVLLVDDVITTGSSLLEADRALTQAGFRVGGAAVIAAVPAPAAAATPPRRCWDGRAATASGAGPRAGQERSTGDTVVMT